MLKKVPAKFTNFQKSSFCLRKKVSVAAFTLIELLVAVAIFGILMVALAQFLVSFLNMKFNAETLQRVRQEGNYALDQIDFLVRNGITLPDLCSTSPLSAADTLKTNTEGTSETSFFQRSRVQLNPDDAKIIMYQPNNSTITHDELNAVNQAYYNDINNSFDLTYGDSGNGTFPLEVSRVSPSTPIFTCVKDPYTGGFLIKTAFKITYARKSFNQKEGLIEEIFERETAIRNTNPFEK